MKANIVQSDQSSSGYPAGVPRPPCNGVLTAQQHQDNIGTTANLQVLANPSNKIQKQNSRRNPANASLVLAGIVVSQENLTTDVKLWLYGAEVFGRWGDRMWQFTAGLFLLELFPGSLLLPAIYGIITGIAAILSGAMIGEWVDKTSRLKAIRIALLTQNSAVALGSLILTFAFLYEEEMERIGKILCVAGFFVFAIIGDCASVAMNVIVEKDWVLVMAQGNKSHLADLNSMVRRIDLTCSILSPIIIAQVMTFMDHYVACIVVSTWNVTSMVIEYCLLLAIYRRVPGLAIKVGNIPQDTIKKPFIRKMFRSCFSIYDGWKIYFNYRVAFAGLGLAFLYISVLSFGGVTNSYIRTQGLSESFISVMMGLGAITGIAGTFAFPVLRGKIGLERTGLYALTAHFLFLLLCGLSVWLPGSPFDPGFLTRPGNDSGIGSVDHNAEFMDSNEWISRPLDELTSVIVFMCGMIGARFGLWMIDLTITQLIQENVAEEERGIVGGLQSSLNRFMDMLKFVLVVFLPYPQTFGILILISIAFVICADCFYAYFSFRSRGHLYPHCQKTVT